MRLSDGSEVVIRPLSPKDRGALVGAFERLSPESRYRRFLSPLPSLSEEVLSYLVDIDHRDHEALLAQDAVAGEALAVARYVRSPEDPATAEVGVAVVDQAQGKGLGSAILERLAERAREEGITRFKGLVLAENRAMLALLRELGSETTKPAGAGTVEATVELPVGGGVGHGLANWLRAAAAERVSFSPPTPRRRKAASSPRVTGS